LDKRDWNRTQAAEMKVELGQINLEITMYKLVGIFPLYGIFTEYE
jgi:hypothetical protein